MAGTQLPRLPIAHLPTPIEALPRLSSELGGPQIWIKRDDLTGLAFGGNKTRKLEYLLAEARAHGAKCLVTRGAVQSNHCRQTAAAAARHGFECVLVLGGHPPKTPGGNFLLDQLLGAELDWVNERDPDAALQEAFQKAWDKGRRPYLIPYGGSNPLGASAYSFAMSEFLNQDLEIDRIIIATSSGGTQAGLLVGAKLHGFKGKVVGISVDVPARIFKSQIATLATETATLLNAPFKVDESEVEVIDDYVGEGYGIVGDLERKAMDVFARKEGILLDPVYTGRAAGGLMDLIRKGVVGSDEKILFWHTGGTPALFAYGKAIF